jgi:hypothetical protein
MQNSCGKMIQYEGEPSRPRAHSAGVREYRLQRPLRNPGEEFFKEIINYGISPGNEVKYIR